MSPFVYLVIQTRQGATRPSPLDLREREALPRHTFESRTCGSGASDVGQALQIARIDNIRFDNSPRVADSDNLRYWSLIVWLPAELRRLTHPRVSAWHNPVLCRQAQSTWLCLWGIKEPTRLAGNKSHSLFVNKSSIDMSLETLKASSLGNLSGKIALITGGGTGLGLMIAKSYAANGAKVYITGRRLEVLQKAADAFPGLIPLNMDVTNKESIAAAAKIVEQNDSKLDILVNNAGIAGQPVFTGETLDTTRSYGKAFFDDESFERWANTITTNTSSAFFVTMGFFDLLVQAATIRRREGSGSETSSVINISSGAGETKLSFFVYSYGVSKAGLNHLTKTLATEFALNGVPIRVNAILPGLFPSQLTTHVPGGLENFAKSTLPGAVNPVPLRRPGREEELGMTAVYLASDAGSYTNGNLLHVDGGQLLVNP
ncbi:hypothetical protein VNI00_004284 [Paramarasmius palmivorus]|uniref:Uncharacterized protein n=1 Tax=Paramarasmius palmivorus TaxID=297713 RepID=A0AAW0DN15_9AGAR